MLLIIYIVHNISHGIHYTIYYPMHYRYTRYHILSKTLSLYTIRCITINAIDSPCMIVGDITYIYIIIHNLNL